MRCKVFLLTPAGNRHPSVNEPGFAREAKRDKLPWWSTSRSPFNFPVLAFWQVRVPEPSLTRVTRIDSHLIVGGEPMSYHEGHSKTP